MHEHTFPLPEIESHKLDVVRHQMELRPGAFPLINRAEPHRWILVTLACVLGVLAGAWLKLRT